MGKKVVVVESPAKAKTINKYLGNDYVVLASYGHIRDLPPKDGSVRPDDDFSMLWEIDGRSKKHVDDINRALKNADTLYLATDPDREGEAISWHVQDVLEKKKALAGKQVHRVTFNAITRNAVTEAIANPRELDHNLIDAYLARRSLDYLVGFNLSPVLWRKLPGSKSAGRVQSVALRLICEREMEIEKFRQEEYWTINGTFAKSSDLSFPARLTIWQNNKLKKFDLPNEETALQAEADVKAGSYRVRKVEHKNAKRNPAPPFTTSTLQQEASRKLFMSAKRTMQVAQKLYEGVDIGGETVGLITYMRTDAIFMAPEAIHATRAMIEKSYDPRYLPSSPRMFKSKQKNAQEAHEAIRPTDAFRHPKDMAKYLDKDQLRLYELIWKRTIASQMASAEVKQAAVDLADPAKGLELHATGSVITFDGFLCLYREDKDDSNGDETNRQLPPLAEGDSVQLQNTSADQHFTQPPPRYTEASLVKKMEELGIGRPSTYASILSVLQDRNYVRLDKRRFIPEDRGRIVTAFLVNYFEKYVEYGFTAGLENQLDDISAGSLQWRQVLRDFWQDFYGAIDNTKELRVSDVLDTLDAQLSAHFFPTVDEDGQPLEKDPRSCPTCGEGRLSLKLGKFGAFIGCSRYPECRYTRPLTDDQDGNSDVADAGPKVLGTDPETGKEITLRKGPYGMYVQLGEEETLPAEIKLTKAGKPAKRQPKPKVLKPKRTSLPRGVEAANFTLEQAIGLLSLPRDVGAHPETGEMITAGLGRFGPFVKHKDLYASLSKDDNVLTIGLNRAVHLIMEKEQAKKLAAGIEIGRHPEDQEPVTRHDGRWGPYVQHKDVRATLPQDTNPEALTLQDALSLLAEKGKKAGTKASAKGSKTAKGKKAPARAAAKGTKSTSKSASKTASPRTRKSTTPSAE